MKDRCQRNKAHKWVLCRVRFGIGLYECQVCKGHNWKRATTFFGKEKVDGDYAPITSGIIEDYSAGLTKAIELKSRSSRASSLGTGSKGKGKSKDKSKTGLVFEMEAEMGVGTLPKERTRKRGAKATQDAARKAERNAQRRRRYRLRKAAGLIAQWRFS